MPNTDRSAIPPWAIGIGPFICKASEELADGAGLPLRCGPIDLVRGYAMIAAGIGFHDAGVDSKPFSFNEPGIHARLRHGLKQLPQDIAVAEAAVTINREG